MPNALQVYSVNPLRSTSVLNRAPELGAIFMPERFRESGEIYVTVEVFGRHFESKTVGYVLQVLLCLVTSWDLNRSL